MMCCGVTSTLVSRIRSSSSVQSTVGPFSPGRRMNSYLGVLWMMYPSTPKRVPSSNENARTRSSRSSIVRKLTTSMFFHALMSLDKLSSAMGSGIKNRMFTGLSKNPGEAQCWDDLKLSGTTRDASSSQRLNWKEGRGYRLFCGGHGGQNRHTLP